MGNFSGKRGPTKLIMVGLDRAGKTTVLHFLKYGEAGVPTGPTIGFNLETVIHEGITFEIWDVSGKERMQQMWRHYSKSANGIIFVVDSTDAGEERIEECKEALKLFLEDDAVRGCNLLVLANKQDLPDAISADNISDKLGLDSIQDRKWHIEPTCAISGVGILDGLDWLASTLGLIELES